MTNRITGKGLIMYIKQVLGKKLKWIYSQKY